MFTAAQKQQLHVRQLPSSLIVVEMPLAKLRSCSWAGLLGSMLVPKRLKHILHTTGQYHSRYVTTLLKWVLGAHLLNP